MDKAVANYTEYNRIISANLYMCVATATRTGEPWISQVYFVTDKNNNFYWYSSVNARHSKLIAENKIVALSIYDSSAVGDDVYALYMKAMCSVITDRKLLIPVLSLYAQKMLKTGFVTNLQESHSFVHNVKDFLGNSELRLYKATPYEISRLGTSKMFNGKYVDRRELFAT
jgi:hypothetical protein